MSEKLDGRVASDLCDQLGPLPKPFGWVHDGMPDGELAFQRNEPEGFAALVHSTMPVYSHAQMLDAMAAERERCAKIAAPETVPYSDDEWRVRCEVRDAIAEGQ